MKFNFWQILGVLLIVVGAIFVIRNQMSAPDTRTPTTIPTIQPETP